MSEACDLSAVEARRRMEARQLSPVELLDSCLRRIEEVDGALNAVVAIDIENAREKARFDEAAIMVGEDVPLLHGMPVGIKDLNPVKGLRTTFGSLLYENHVPAADDTAGTVTLAQIHEAWDRKRDRRPLVLLHACGSAQADLVYGAPFLKAFVKVWAARALLGTDWYLRRRWGLT